MAVWQLTRGLTSWRGEINVAFPQRKKDSDGSIGDSAHAQGTSGHNDEASGHAEYNDHDGINEVRAIDVDKDLMNPKFTMEQLIQWLVKLGRAGAYLPFRYFIYKGRIWRKSTGWKTEEYTGANSHSEHAHFSGDYTQKADNWTGTLGLVAYVKKMTGEDEFMGFIDTQAQFETALDAYFKKTTQVGPAVVRTNLKHPVHPGRTIENFLFDLWGVRDTLIGDKAGNVPADSPLGKLLTLPGIMVAAIASEAARDAQDAARDAALASSIDLLSKALNAATGSKLTDAQFQELKTAILEKVAEAGQDATDQATAKLDRLVDALDNAGAALSGVSDDLSGATTS